MSSLSSLPARDLEQLSAYADGELAPAEADRLRARLEQDARLRQALHELRQTADLLRALPLLAAPRSFALPADKALARRQYPRLQLATALASLGFLVAVGVDVLTQSALRAVPLSPTVGQLAPRAAEQDLLEAEPEEQPAAEAELGLEAAGSPEAAAAQADESAPAEDELPAGLAPTPTAAAEMLAAEAPAEEGSPVPRATVPPPAVGQADSAATGLPTGTAHPAGTSPPPATLGALAQEFGEAGSEVAGEYERSAAQPAEAPPPAQDEQPDGFRGAPPQAGVELPLLAVRMLEAALAVVAVLLGLLSLRWRRRM